MKDMYQLDNVSMFDPVPKGKLPEILASADGGLILHGSSPTYRETASPNKFYDYISAGLPIVSNYDGDMGELIQRYNVGYVSKTIDDEVYILNKMERDRSYLKNLADNAEILSKEVDIEKQKILFVEMIERIGAFRYPEST